MSLNTVMNPHRKNRVVMIANGPREDWPSVELVEPERAWVVIAAIVV
jgi:hypothetical protein